MMYRVVGGHGALSALLHSACRRFEFKEKPRMTRMYTDRTAPEAARGGSGSPLITDNGTGPWIYLCGLSYGPIVQRIE